MKKVLLNAVLLSGVLAYAQEKDTINAKKIDEVIINSYIKKDSDYVNKMPLKSIENPQVYSSIDKVVLDNQLIYTVDDALRNVTGVQRMWSANNRAGDGGAYINLRGFISSNSMRNGLVGPVTTSMDAINLEKAEVLKGPSATLYGSNVTSYGGVVNRVTKRPFETLEGRVSLIGGSYNYYRAQADVNTPLTKDKRLMFRVNTAYTTEGTFQNKNAGNTYFAFTPSLRYKINDVLDINLEYEGFETRAVPEQVFFYLSPALGKNMKDVENLGLDYKNSYMGSGLYTTARVRNLFGQVNVKINDNIRSSTNISNSYSYSDGFNPYFYIAPKATATGVATDTELGVVRADQSTINSTKKFFQIQQNFNFDYKFGSMRNRTVAGFDYMRTNDNQMFAFIGVVDWVPFRGGDYSTLNDKTLGAKYDELRNRPGYDFNANNTWPSSGVLNTYSGYISNVLTPIEGLNVLASVRYESNQFNGGKRGQAAVAAYSQSAWSPKFGLVYEIIKDQFSVFGNYQNSFKSNGYYVYNKAGDVALSDPEKANQFEGGLKANLLKGKITATLSYYDIKVKNTLMTTRELTVGGQAVQNQAGKLTSRGLEAEINAYLVKGFSLIAGLSYNDMSFTSGENAGFRPETASSPWLANFNASYQFVDGQFKGLGFGIGGNYASDNKIVNTVQGSFILPKYFVMNANAYYDTKKFRIGVKVDNFTNEHYWIGYTTANPQKLANVLGSITYKF
ncbi:TonB-dependent siderophore receptor [Elizabethkingia anophelis]|uniref:TonB-dependent receptor n=1 Tax=Elizabethkingia anophelis R26 TaxID=1246994 RepID=A0ABM6MWG9_9FLAO|nr:TonB-dependent receptor [Elizabethkingia anophelis]ATC37477.1 TonB-dependent receptor [Elizabethkingia anophelis R26]ATC41156.1 TonB-dependent receptor [Elizabethkingia anophelis Ag1]ATC44833.1 TonB-dependent receptor [Elizabethkingia anophelis]ATC48509.1 TonB-dependent receptor [Elizabethkingia anophelis]ELR77723.1 TonB-dependent siderophore receptor [Elizabethkingia anophelis R26]